MISISVPGSKSLTNRALLIAALANGTTRLTNALFSDDSRCFANALQTLGFDVRLDELNSEMTVTGLGGKIPATKADLFIGNAGTAARFLSTFLTLGHGEFILDGDARMRERPIGDLVHALTQLGAIIQPIHPFDFAQGRPSSFILHPSISLPLKILASGLPGGKTKIVGDISSQFLSALLMVAPYANSPIEIELTTNLNSQPYVDMTLAVMRDFGVEVQRNGYQSFALPLARYVLGKQVDTYTGTQVHTEHAARNTEHATRDTQHGTRNTQHAPPTNYHLPITTYPIESDASSASYFFAAPAILGRTVRVENISCKSKQGDIAFLDVLQQMGCAVTEGENFIEVTGSPSLRGLDVDMRDLPDTAQTLATIAPFASSPTRIRGIASARLKETDRIHAVCAELTRLGVRVDEHDDGMTIYPCEKFTPAEVRTYNDHRMAMAFALIGLRVPGIVIENPACVSKTFPNFFEVLEKLL